MRERRGEREGRGEVREGGGGVREKAIMYATCPRYGSTLCCNVCIAVPVALGSAGR